MITKIIMPKLSETMESGILITWLKREGERVEKGEPFFEVVSDKATFEIESPVSGFVKKIIYPADPEREIPIAETIAYVADTMEEELPIEQEVIVGQETSERIKATPLAKKIAKDKKVDISVIKGSGPDGRITEKDVLEYIEKFAAAPTIPEVEIMQLSGLRKIIAERVSKSKHDAPHYYLQAEIDMDEIVELREQSDKSFSYNDILIKFTALALEEFPLLNATFEDEKINIHKKINIGVAIAAESGLIAPVIKDANQKTLNEISKEMNKFIEKAKIGRFNEDDLSGGTFTISNLGMYGIDIFTAIINPPQVAILAVGKIKEAPQVKAGKIKKSWLMKVSLSLDHRVIDGAYGAQFLERLKELLENPYEALKF